MIANLVSQSWNKPEKHLAWQFVIMHTPQSVKLSLSQSIVTLFCYSVSLSVITQVRVSESVNQWASEPVSQWVSESVSQWVSESVSQWVSESVSQWVSELRVWSTGCKSLQERFILEKWFSDHERTWATFETPFI